jgi:hypothetical protein
VLFVLALLSVCCPPARALDDLVITEFMAENDNTLDDEDGDASDWIEIFNAGTNSVNLGGWHLTDSQGSLGWTFPATNLPINSFIVVFASGKDRRIPGRPLHTDFRLNDQGDYLALLKPDGTVQSSYAPTYPLQVPGISYGIPVTLSSTTLLTTGAAGKFTVPLNSALGVDWTYPGFNDGSWASVNNGVGFEGDPAVISAPTLMADSITEFGGNQGGNGWFYGYWDRKADGDGFYTAGEFIPFPRGTGNVLAPTNFWNGSKWDFPAGDPSLVELTAGGGQPTAENGNVSLPVQWAIRRYVSEINGPLRITGTLACQSQNGLCGDGILGRIFVDGVEVFNRSVKYSSEGYSIVVAANPGSTIDFVIDAGNANNDFCDATTFTARIFTTGGAAIVADTIADWSISGTQGEKNWTYGLFNATTGGAYATAKFAPFPNGTGPHSSGNFWNGEEWKWFDGDPPFDTIGRIETQPNVFATGGTNAHQHWVIRRWLSEVSGTIHVDWHISKKDLTGGGVTASIYQNGTQRDTFVLPGADFVGTNRTITISGVQVGDAIDLAVAAGTDVIGDLCFLNATIHGDGTVAGQFASDVGALMTNLNASAYLRLPFTVADAAIISSLTLRMKHDDGFAAYLNGNPVASANAPGTLEWNSSASGARPDADAAQFQDFTLDNWRDFLVNGNNVLAIHGLNAGVSDPDFLLAAQLVAVNATLNPGARRYFSGPTPGSLNGVGTTTIGPLITRVQHKPAEPADAEDLVVSARVSPTLNGVTNVTLFYRVMYGAEVPLTMLDDGLHGDGVAGDGVYGASIPNTAYTPGRMVRYYFIARDSASNQSRQPPIGDTNNSSLYFGTVVQDPALTNQLPVLHWFTPTLVESTTFQRVSMYWLGEFYDNIKMNTHGQSSGGFRNHSFNVDFNPDHNFKPSPDLPRVDDINLLSSYADKAHMRLMLSYQIYNDSGPRAPYHYVVPARMQSNGVFHSIMHITENGDDKYLERIGRDRNGPMYKMYTDPSQPANAEKKTRRWEDKSDFSAFVAGINSSTNRLYLHDNLDVSEAINFFAAMIITASVDCCHKNFYLYRDTDGDGEWEMLPWDLDLSFGRNWQSGETYWDDRVYPQNGLFVGGTFPLGNVVFNTNPNWRAMYLRRVRTLQDELLQTNGTPYTELNFERQIDQWTEMMRNDSILDIAKWGSWGMGNGGAGGTGTRIDTTNMICARTGEPSVPCWRTMEEAAIELKTNYLVRRRTYVFNQKMGGTLPDSQPPNAVVLIGATPDYNPSSGNQNEEYLTLVNTNSYAVDISGWRLDGAVEHTFQGGVVIPSGPAPTNTLYVVPDKKSFRRRATSPRGGQGLYIEGPYQGQLSARGETIVLIDKAGRTNRTFTYTGNPSGPQRYLRITEIMYHPPKPPTGSPYEAEEFEYLEIRNTGPTNLNLSGVRFANGVEFDFTGSAVTSLAPGARVLVVKNLAAFTSRYGSGLNVAGQYVGSLDNGGERLQLHDAVGESIHDFDYENDWYPITDGPGASLVIVDENADERLWGSKTNWRPSAFDFGAPGVDDPAPAPAPPAIVINELLTHTDLPQVDAIELFNPTATAANIGGWFLSDDFASPKKFRVPDGTVIPAGGFLVFYESNSFGVGANAFAIRSKGDETFLFSGDGVNLTGYLQGYAFGAAENGVSFGRYLNSQTNVHFVAQSALTLGAANAAPKVGPVVLSEINYRPDEMILGVDNTIDEFIELANISGADVPLFDPANPANTWRLRGAVDFDIPPNVTLPSGGHLVIVGFNPAETALFNTFTSRFSVPGQVRVLGPWDGQLGNLGESLRLLRPDAPDTNDVPYVLVEQVDYSNRAPWTAAADGIGLTLQRLLEPAYGNDPTNWIGAAASAAAPYIAGGTAPSITSSPQNVTAVAGRSVSFTVSVAGTPPFSYRWRFNGTNPVGSSPTLTLNSVQANQAGVYSVIVFNSAGSAVSAGAQLSVVFPPKIIQQPLGRAVYIKPDPRAANAPDGTNVTFVVGASSGNPGLGYQWFFNGANIPGATGTSLTITNVQLEDEGDYTVAVSDSVDTVMSTAARLVPWLQPVIVKPPVGQAIAAGSDFTMSVEVTGNPLPVAYSWRRGSIVIATNSGNYRSNFVTLNAAAVGLILTNNILSSNYTMRLVVYNDANNSPGVLVSFTNTVMADLDLDGIPDEIEQSYGLSGSNPADALLDSDGDGINNRSEFLAGTDPTNSLSYLRIEQGPGATTVSVAAVSNRTYTVQYTDNLNSGVWRRLGDIVARPNHRVESLSDSGWTTNRFYRVVLPRQP